VDAERKIQIQSTTAFAAGFLREARELLMNLVLSVKVIALVARIEVTVSDFSLAEVFWPFLPLSAPLVAKGAELGIVRG
jgi:hypothetical protein